MLNVHQVIIHGMNSSKFIDRRDVSRTVTGYVCDYPVNSFTDKSVFSE